MRKIVVIHTTKSTIKLTEKLLDDPNTKLIHILDETILIKLEVDLGDPSVAETIEDMVRSGCEVEPDCILFACSTIGDYTRLEKKYGFPIYRIDANLVKDCKQDEKILMLATIATTKNPSLKLFENYDHVDFQIVTDALNQARSGHKNIHDKLIVEKINSELENYDHIVLAQASMHDAGMLANNSKVITSISSFDSRLK